MSPAPRQPGSTEAAAPQGLRRRIGLPLYTLYGLGVMVGAGVYVLIGEIAGRVGPWAPLAFAAAGVAASFSALSFAELSRRIPESAGEAAYVRRAFGAPTFAVVIGVAVCAVGLISAAAVLRGGVGYLSAFVAAPEVVLIVLAGLALGAVSALGVEKALAFAAIFTVLEIAGLLAVIAAGALAEPIPAATAPETPLSAVALLGAAFLAFFAFIGFEDMVNMAEEVREPDRTLPRGIIIAVAITVVLYVAVAWAVTRVASGAELAESTRPLALAFERATGWSGDGLGAIAVLAAINGVIAQLVMAARVLYGLGARSPAFAIFRHVSARTGAPDRATALATLVMLILALTTPLETLASVTSFVILAVFIVINAALIQLRRSGLAEGAPGFKAPVWAPYAGVAAALLMCAGEILRLTDLGAP